MANENLLFRKGTLKELLNSTPIEGSINFTTDEPAIYLDVKVNGETKHKRIGDIIQFNYLSEFTNFVTEHGEENIPQSALYYIQKDKNDAGEDVIINALLKWNGENYLQLNEKSDYSGSLDFLESRVYILEGDVENLKVASEDQDKRLVSIEELLGITKDDTGDETPEQPGEGETSPTLINRVEELEAIVTNKETGVAANANKIGQLDSKVTGIEGILENLPRELNATINAKINAANAMNYMGTLAPNEEGMVIWPTIEVRAGDTYVASSDFYDINLGDVKQVYAGDLLIASGTEDENGFITGDIAWNVVNTGYQAAHDQFLSVDQNQIVLSSHNNIPTSVEIAGSDNVNITTDTANNKIIINMVWGSFGQ